MKVLSIQLRKHLNFAGNGWRNFHFAGIPDQEYTKNHPEARFSLTQRKTLSKIPNFSKRSLMSKPLFGITQKFH